MKNKRAINQARFDAWLASKTYPRSVAPPSAVQLYYHYARWLDEQSNGIFTPVPFKAFVKMVEASGIKTSPSGIIPPQLR